MKRLIALFALCASLGVAAPALAQQSTEGAGVPAAAQTEAKPAEAAPVTAAPVPAPAAPAPAPAEEKKPTLDSGSTAWMITATVLVIMMTIPGLALFYGGLVRAKNALSILMQVFITFSLVSVLWALFAYSLAFTEGAGALNKVIGGLSKAFMKGITPETLSGVIPEYVFATFQMTFAAITPALIVGAFAERIKFSAVLWFMALWLVFCYAPIAHMVWGGGWLADLGAKDFAGGTVVHVNAGIAGLVGALVLGKRVGYGREPMPPHNLGLTMVGASLLWVGWFGFNVGSELAADGIAGMVLANTQFATAAAVLGWMFVEWMSKGKPSMLGAASGAIAGLVAITPACGFVGPMGALVIGALAGIICYWAVTSLKHALGYDDSLDVFGVHGVGGMLGAILTGVFMSAGLGGVGYPEGVSMGGQVMKQIIATLTTIVWTGILSFVIYKVIDATIGLRVTEEEEREGLDVTSHGEKAYN
ncbi:ammonium transporter [Pelomicrobium sp. G1]|uniref:ammonium transporter n=1 Tax=unclassified Pelomicrobium TaxID=2815318 RepID=UPI003F76C36A